MLHVFLQTAAGGLAGGSSLPPTSILNYLAGQTRANNGNAGMGPEGDLALRCMQSSGTAHVVLEVNGYFTSPQP